MCNVNDVCVQEDSRYEQVEDVRSQLKFFEQLDQLEKQKKEEQEREILMKAAKVSKAPPAILTRAHTHTHTYNSTTGQRFISLI